MALFGIESRSPERLAKTLTIMPCVCVGWGACAYLKMSFLSHPVAGA